ncbi:MAG: PQQ-binding-like beta-propeller repeat protein [Verrucomicrobiales bacterium]|nr:PQQ-binding-like beta-propeller repeat protein [Verrucomicrobiales bacterium]
MKRSFVISAFIAIIALGPVQSEENWNQFRGPTGRGHSDDKNVPVKWSEDSVIWSVDLPGTGQSSPVNWGDRVFLTSAEDMGKIRNVICVDLNTGKERWKQSIPCSNPEDSHKMNSFATPSCATDGNHVFAFFGPGGFHCFDMDGNKVWSKDLGDFPGDWGIAASPILVGNWVVQNCDCSGPSRLVAFDKKTGNIMWDTTREAKPKGGWSTPILIDHEGRKEIVLNGEFGVRGYDPATGKELWFCKGFNGRGAPVPDYSNGALYVVNGKPGDLYSVTPGGSGDVTTTHMRWHQGRKAGRDLPSPAVVGNYMQTVSMNGIGTCFDTSNGKILWNDRLGVKGEFAASPLVANGLVYFIDVFGGNTIVIKPGPTLEIVAQNSIGAKGDEIFRSTLAPINGKMLIRSQSRLYCVQ